VSDEHEGFACSSDPTGYMPQSRVALSSKCDRVPTATVYFSRGQPRRVICDLGRGYMPFPDEISIPTPVVTSSMPEAESVGKENSQP
jgi:hypothetical protein